MDLPEPTNPHSSARATFLTVLLMSLFGAGAFVFSLILFGPLFFGFLTVIAVIAAIGFGHYLLWGRSDAPHVLLDEERDDDPHEGNGWSTDGPHPHRRF